MQILTVKALKNLVGTGDALDAVIHVQVEAVWPKSTKDGKPYYEVQLIDVEDRIGLRAWNDSAVYAQCAELQIGQCVEVAGEFCRHASFGLEARRWTLRPLSGPERAALLGGPAEVRERQAADFQYVLDTVQTLVDPRLRILCEMFLVENGDRFRRSAAARTFHHARRGGLVEHTAQMMRAAVALSAVYARLNRDLLLAGVLFHDAGKLWENHVAEEGFGIEHCERGELLGHINLGVELVNSLWRQLKTNEEYAGWHRLEPSSECVRMHLLHLIVSHHGELAFGSPIVPKTPEACALHSIDNLDAKMEMVFRAYDTAAQVAPRIYDRTRPLPGFLVEPLKPFPADADPSGGWMGPLDASRAGE